MIGQNINSYFNAAMMYPVERLEAVIRGQDKSIPAAAAMMALPLKQREVAAAVGMQTAQQPQPNNLRQQMVQATMPQMPQMPQGMQQIPQQSPQQVAQLPENTGLMNLPAPNMEKMAGGGIIAFADGGDTDGVAHFDSGDLVKQDEQDREDLAYGFKRFGAAAKDIFSMPGRVVAGVGENLITRPLRAAGVPVPYLPADFYGGDRTAFGGATPYTDAIRREEAAKTPAAPATTPATTKPAPTAEEEALKKYRTEKKKGTGTKSGTKSGTDMGGTPKAPASSSKSYEDYVKQVGAGDKDILDQYAKAGEEETTGMKALLAEREKDKPGGKAGDSMEKYLKEKAISEPQRRQQNFQMALVNAGLGIAAGNSQHWMQNVATGSKEAIKEYRAGIDKLDAAADERAKLMSSIEDARRAEAKGDWKELYEVKKDIEKTKASYKRAGIDAIVATTGATKKAAADIFTNAQTNERAIEQAHITGKYDLAGRKIMASAYGNSAKLNPANIATDNAAKALETWKGSQEGKLAQARDPSAYAKKERELIAQHFMMQGLPNPFTTSGKNLFNDPKEQAAYEAFAGG